MNKIILLIILIASNLTYAQTPALKKMPKVAVAPCDQRNQFSKTL